MKKLAVKLLDMLSHVSHEKEELDWLAWWAVHQSTNMQLARLIYFAERVLHHGENNG